MHTDTLLRAERDRRTVEHFDASSLQTYEATYFGIEVGHQRRYFNRLMAAHIPACQTLLDYGCGGAWWKDYWHNAQQITAVDILDAPLRHIREAFPDPERVRVLVAPTGVTTLPDASFDCVVSSGVVGYIHPDVATVHVREIARLLKPGGVAVFSRVNAWNYATVKRGQLMETGGGWAYRYRRGELRRLLASAGLAVQHEQSMGIHCPVARPWVQYAYGFRVTHAMDRLVSLCRLFAVHHLMVASRS